MIDIKKRLSEINSVFRDTNVEKKVDLILEVLAELQVSLIQQSTMDRPAPIPPNVIGTVPGTINV